MVTSFCKDTQFLPLSNLRVLRVSPMYVGPWTDCILNSVYSSSRASLRSLKLDGVQNAAHVDTIISRFVQLEEFSSSIPWPMTGSPPLTLHHLTSLNVICHVVCFGRLHLPQLQSLTINDRPPQQQSDEKFCRSVLPNLHTLTLTIQKTEWLEHIAAPQLRFLSINGVVLPSAHNPSSPSQPIA